LQTEESGAVEGYWAKSVAGPETEEASIVFRDVLREVLEGM